MFPEHQQVHKNPVPSVLSACILGILIYLFISCTLGDPIFETTALKAARAIWSKRSAIGLVSVVYNNMI